MYLNHAKAFACILITFYHAFGYSEKFQTEKAFQLDVFFGNMFFYSRVPFFLVVAGYLFHHSYTRSGDIRSTTIKRVKNLIPPYLFWNIVMMMIILTGLKLGYTYGVNKSFSLSEVAKMTSGIGSMPANGPLWFVRDLIFLFLISPFLIRIKNFLPYIGLISLLISINYQDANFFKINSLGFYSIGLYMYQLIQPKELEKKLSLIPKKSIYVFLASMFGIALINQSQIMPYEIGILSSFLGISMIVMIGELLTRETGSLSNISLAVSESGFFIYVTHMPVLGVFKKTVEHIKPFNELLIHSPLINFFVWSIFATTIITGTTFLHHFIKQRSPKWLIILSGSR